MRSIMVKKPIGLYQRKNDVISDVDETNTGMKAHRGEQVYAVS